MRSRLHASKPGSARGGRAGWTPDRTGRPLPAPLQAAWAPRLGHSLANIRIHADDAAARPVRRRGGVALAVGRDVLLDRARVRPGTHGEHRVLAHEVAHLAQQGFRSASPSEAPTLRSAAHEADADRVATALLDGRSARPATHAPPAVQLLTPAQFQRQLGSTPEQRLAIDTLFTRPAFSGLFAWIGACRATPAQDLGPLALRVTPGLMAGGIVRYGGYTSLTRTLEINPTKPEHLDNPSELVDTVFHETIHAADDLDAPCRAAGSPAAPLHGAATSVLPPRAGLSSATQAVLDRLQGPGASDPCGEFLDINAAAQKMVTDAVASDVSLTGVGRPTITFVNVIIRGNSAAFTSYDACRRRACASTGTTRTSALAACSTETIAEFLPPSLLPALLPAQIQFGFASAAISAHQRPKLDLVARFLIHHRTRTVEIVGHTDAVGTAAFNLVLGQQRADAVKADLLARGVPAGQIRGTSSLGEAAPISGSTAEHWRDRRVEIKP